MWIMLNPSTADATHNDPTIERCQRRAVMDGYGTLIVCNLFALRTTDPRLLYTATDPVGPGNDLVIGDQIRNVSAIVCGWGDHGRLHRRSKRVLAILRALRAPVFALGVNASGEPRHPLYVPYRIHPAPMLPQDDDAPCDAPQGLRCSPSRASSRRLRSAPQR